MLLDSKLKEHTPAPSPGRDVVSLLPPGARERAIEAVTRDPRAELEEIRDHKLGSAMTAHLTHLISCGPQALRDKLRGLPVRIDSVEATAAPGSAHFVYYSIPNDHELDAMEVHRCLEAAAPTLRASLARQMQLIHFPALRFIPQVAVDKESQAQLFRRARRNRKAAASGTMQGWISEMHF